MDLKDLWDTVNLESLLMYYEHKEDTNVIKGMLLQTFVFQTQIHVISYLHVMEEFPNLFGSLTFFI